MKISTRPIILALALGLAACGSETAPPAAPDNEAAANAAESAEAPESPALPACPFRSTSGWAGSIEGGRLLVTGTVDLQMAGFRPTLTPREDAGGAVAFDLALAPEPQAAVTSEVRYERSGAPVARRGEIWCGGDRIAEFDVVVID
jgi:hypothetical protein